MLRAARLAMFKGWERLEPRRAADAFTSIELRAVRRLTRTIRRLKTRRLTDELVKRATVLPIRYAIHLVHSQRRTLFYRELLLFSVFVITLLCLLLSHSPEIHECYETTAVLTEAFDLQLDGLDANSPFNEAKSPADFWAWLGDDLADAIFSADPRLGSLSMLQMRIVRELPAKHAFHTRDGVYEFDTQRHARGWASDAAGWETTCGGVDARGTPRHLLGSNLCLEHRRDWSFLRNTWLKPLGYADYGYGGYGKLLSTTDRAQFDEHVQFLSASELVDENVVAVALSLNVLNARSNLLSVVRILFEFSRTGNVMNSALVASVRGRVYDFDLRADVVRLLLAVVLYAAVMYYSAVMVRDWARSGARWLLDWFNLCELAILASTLCCAASYARFLQRHDHALQQQRWMSEDIAGVASAYHVILTMMAWTFLLCICKTFKYLRLDKSMMLLFDVLASASVDLASFLLIFVLVLLAFALVGHFAFGPALPLFHTPMEALITCMRLIIGDLEYEALRNANPVLAPIFFLAYALGAVLVLINVFIAILNEYYTEVKALARREATDFDAMTFANQQKALGRVSRAVTLSSLVGGELWSCVVRLGTARLRVHEAQAPLTLRPTQPVLVCAHAAARALAERDDAPLDARARAPRLRDGRRADDVSVARLIVSHDLTYWAREADTLELPSAGVVLRVDAVKTHGLLCQVASAECASSALHGGLVRPGARIVHSEYKSKLDEMLLVGLLAMARWRLIELDRKGAQVLNTQQLLEVVTNCMLGRARRSLYTPVGFLARHTSERQEKRDACRAMARRCERGETSDLDRLQVRTLVLPSIISIMDKYGFDDSHGEFAVRTAALHKPARTVQMVATLSVAAAQHHDGELPRAPLGGEVERKLDLLLEALVESRAEQRALRLQIERLEARVETRAGGSSAWADADDDESPSS